MTQPTAQAPIGAVAAEVPGAAGVLLRLDVDFSFAGERSLAEACAARGLAPNAVLAELERAAADAPPPPWAGASTEALIRHIVEAYHRPLPGRLAALRALTEQVARDQAGDERARFGALRLLLRQLEGWLLSHLRKEEAGLFPALLSGRPAEDAAGIVRGEHADQATMLARLRELTDRFTPPPDASDEHAVLYRALAALDAELRLHVHLEDNVLLPRAGPQSLG